MGVTGVLWQENSCGKDVQKKNVRQENECGSEAIGCGFEARVSGCDGCVLVWVQYV